LPEGKRSPPPATPSFRVENTFKDCNKRIVLILNLFQKPEAFFFHSRNAHIWWKNLIQEKQTQ
jgi:hypothetical protein